jgi:uncharacterized membrane protein
MRSLAEKIGIWLKTREKIVLFVAISLTAIGLIAACFWKYGIFGYNAIDLAYFNQVFWNTVHGRPFSQSIHPHLSLGDHAEIAILPLAFLYALWRDPRTLLLLQAVALALPAYAVWRIAAVRLARTEHGKLKAYGPLVLALAYLLNPSVHNIALFEFHILPFAIAPLLMAMLAYAEGRKGRFLAWSVLALLVREDVALVIIMVGVLAAIEKKPAWWRVVPPLLGAAWFAAAMRLIAAFSPEGAYKYRIYYAWLGATPLAMAGNAVAHPLGVLAHIATVANLEMALGFLMPLLFLPLLAPAALVLAAGPLLQIVLGAPGGGELIIDTHYATLFLPALMLAAIDGFAAAPAAARKLTRLATPDEAARSAGVLLLLAATYGAATLGPLPSVVRRITSGADAARSAAARAILARIPPDASVASAYALLPALSSRERLTSLHYVFLGVTQFGEKPYAPPDDIAYAAVDADDLLVYATQFAKTAWAAPQIAGGPGRLRAVLGAPAAHDSPFALFVKNGVAIKGAEAIADTEPDGVISSPYLVQAAARFTTDALAGGPALVIASRWAAQGFDDAGLVIHTIVTASDGRTIAETRQPLVATPPFSFPIPGGYEVVTRLRSSSGRSHAGGAVTVSLEREDASYELDGIRSATRVVTGETALDVGTVFIR